MLTQRIRTLEAERTIVWTARQRLLKKLDCLFTVGQGAALHVSSRLETVRVGGRSTLAEIVSQLLPEARQTSVLCSCACQGACQQRMMQPHPIHEEAIDECARSRAPSLEITCRRLNAQS